MTEGLLDVLLTAVDKSLGVVGTGMAAVTVVVLRAAGGQVSKIMSTLDDHQNRLNRIELTYVAKDDLEEILESLQRDLKGSFERAHTRIDELYRSPRKD